MTRWFHSNRFFFPIVRVYRLRSLGRDWSGSEWCLRSGRKQDFFQRALVTWGLCLSLDGPRPTEGYELPPYWLSTYSGWNAHVGTKGYIVYHVLVSSEDHSFQPPNNGVHTWNPHVRKADCTCKRPRRQIQGLRSIQLGMRSLLLIQFEPWLSWQFHHQFLHPDRWPGGSRGASLNIQPSGLKNGRDILMSLMCFCF